MVWRGLWVQKWELPHLFSAVRGRCYLFHLVTAPVTSPGTCLMCQLPCLDKPTPPCQLPAWWHELQGLRIQFSPLMHHWACSLCVLADQVAPFACANHSLSLETLLLVSALTLLWLFFCLHGNSSWCHLTALFHQLSQPMLSSPGIFLRCPFYSNILSQRGTNGHSLPVPKEVPKPLGFDC